MGYAIIDSSSTIKINTELGITYKERDNGSTIRINNEISTTNFTQSDQIAKSQIVGQISSAIKQLETYQRYVDNCGYDNCCQSCQQLCKQCTGNRQCKCQNVCTQCLNCSSADRRTLVPIPALDEEPVLTKGDSSTERFLTLSPTIINGSNSNLTISGDTQAVYHNSDQTYTINYRLKNSSTTRWNGKPDDYVHQVNWHVQHAASAIPVTFRYTVFEDFNYNTYNYSFTARTIPRAPLVISDSEHKILENAFVIGTDKPSLRRSTRTGYSVNRLIMEFLIPGVTNTIKDAGYYYYSHFAGTVDGVSSLRSSASIQQPLVPGTISGRGYHSLTGKFITSTLFPVTTTTKPDSQYFWIDILYLGKQDADHYGTSWENSTFSDSLGVISFDITECEEIGVPPASYSFVISQGLNPHNSTSQGLNVTSSFNWSRQSVENESSTISITGPRDIARHEGCRQNDYDEEINDFGWSYN